MAFQEAFHGIYYTATAVLFLSGIAWCFPQHNLENLQLLGNIEKSLNASVNPCDNFYGYACGNWAKHFATADVFEIITLLNDRFEAAVEDVIKSKYPDQNFINRHNQNFMEKALTYYYSCTNRGTLNLLKYIHEIKLDHDLEWPLLGELLAATSNNFGRNQHLPDQESLTDLDIFGLLGSLGSYNFNSAMIQLAFQRSNGTLVLAIQVPEHATIMAKEITRILSSLGFPGEANSRLTMELLKMDNYWQSSYKKYSSYADMNIKTFGEVKYLYPSLAKFLENVFLPLEIQPEDTVFFSSLSYIEFLVGHKWQPHEMAKISNYLLVKFLLYLEGNQEKKCTTWLRRKMSLAVNYMYYENIYLQEGKQLNANVTSLTQIIFKHFSETIDRNRLHYTPQQMQRTKQRIREMVLNVGNLPKDVNLSKVDAFFSDIPDLDVNNFYRNDLLLLKHQFMESSTCLGHVACDPNLNSSPMNYVVQNLLVIPLSSLQPPMYHYQLHPLFTLSLLGFSIGHEFTHAIDPDTLQMDAYHSSLLIDDIVTTSPYFHDSLECMQNQHRTDFIRERVADFVGTKVAYQAYDADFHLQPVFTQIPWQQLFFLNLAQFFCGSDMAAMKSHESDEVRLNQIAMNSEEFSQAFQCSSASRMNPLEKCTFY